MKDISWRKIGSRAKLILLLIVPSSLFVTIVLQSTQDYARDFLRQTQNEALAGMSNQVVHLIEVYMNEITFNMLELDQLLRAEERTEDKLVNAMEIAAKIRSDFVRGIGYVDRTGHVGGYPGSFWGNFSETEEAAMQEQWARSSGSITWSAPYHSKIGSNGQFTPVSLATKTVTDERGERVAVLGFVIDLTAFLTRSAAFAGSYDTQTLLYDDHDQLIDTLTNTPRDTTPKKISDSRVQSLTSALDWFNRNGTYHAVSALNSPAGWKVVVVGDVEKLEKRFEPVNRIFWVVLLFVVVGFIVIHVAVSWWFTRPIVSLTRGIRRVAKGELDYRLDTGRQDEFGELALQFNRMTATIRELIDNLWRTEERKRNSDFKALLSQINPHFLYNTLNTIDMMIDYSPKKDLHSIIAVLCRLLKYGLDRTDEQRPLAEEFTYVKDYLYIQAIRYDNQFEFDVRPLGELAEVRVLKLLLQPLVENAVFHGLHPLEERAGKLVVSAEPDGSDLVIRVADNGVGMPAEKVRALEHNLRRDEDVAIDGGVGFGIGVCNVHRRIRLYYGERYGLSLQSEAGSGTTVTLRLPGGIGNDNGGSFGTDAGGNMLREGEKQV